MGFNDERKFEQRLEEIFGLPAKLTEDVPGREKLKELYDKGFDDGAQAQKDYDPKWDAD